MYEHSILNQSKNQKNVQILLATYNGAEFISEQLDSLFAQTYKDFTILVRDDQSTDDTLSVIASYQLKHPNQIFLLEDGKRAGGAKNNFAFLLEASSAPYVMFCDQDDVWDADKVEVTLEKMQKAEQVDPTMPTLVHGDLRVVDRDLQHLHPSFKQVRKFGDRSNALSTLLVQCSTTGCTMMLNRPLVKASLPIPPEAIMHDYWVGLVAKVTGKMVEISGRTLLQYRQHGKNESASRFPVKSPVFFIFFVARRKITELWQRHHWKSLKMWIYEFRQMFAPHYRQAEKLLSHVNNVDEKTRNCIERFFSIEKSSFIQKKYTLLRYNYLPEAKMLKWMFWIFL